MKLQKQTQTLTSIPFRVSQPFLSIKTICQLITMIKTSFNGEVSMKICKH